MSGIEWRKDLQKAQEEIRGGSRLLLLFFNGGVTDEGSKKLEEETLMDEHVQKLVERECLPMQFHVQKDQEISNRFHVDWTPALILADENGNEVERFVGYLPPKEFMAQIILSKGLSVFHLGRFAEAKALFEEIVEEFPDSELIPEAEYFLGAAKFKESGDTYALGEVCHTLMTKYPDSTWTKRCSVWSHVYTASRKPFEGYYASGSYGSGQY